MPSWPVFWIEVNYRKLGEATEDSVTVTFTFKPEIEAGLLARAEARGMDLQEYLQSVVEREVLPSAPKTILSEPTRRQDAVRRMLEFGEKYHLSLGGPITRELLHEGHRYYWRFLFFTLLWLSH